MKQFSKKYNLEERTAEFGENIIEFCKNLKQDIISKPIMKFPCAKSTGACPEPFNYVQGKLCRRVSKQLFSLFIPRSFYVPSVASGDLRDIPPLALIPARLRRVGLRQDHRVFGRRGINNLISAGLFK